MGDPSEQSMSKKDYYDMKETVQETLQSENPAHSAVDWLGNTFGWWPLLGLIGFGAFFIFRKKIRKWLKDFLYM